MRRPAVRLTPDEKIVRRKWAVAILGVLAAVVVATLTVPAFQNESPTRSASAAPDPSAVAGRRPGPGD